MRLLLILIIYLFALTLFSSNPANERLETILANGIDAFESNICKNDDVKKVTGAISYFEDYINLGGERSNVLKYLAYCKISVGQSKKEEIDALKEGVKLLSELFESDQKNIEILKLLLYLHMELKDYDKAKTYAILTNEEKDIDNSIHLLIARLYFNTKEYNKVVNYALKYEEEKDNKEFIDEKLFMIAYSYFKLNNNAKAKKSFNDLMKRKKVSQELINISKLTLNKIDQNENFGKYPNWLNINLSTGLIFDSNVPSAFSSSEDTTGDFPGIPTVEGVDSSVSSIGGRFENYISIFLYPLNLNKHSIILNLNNFLALHYPSIIDDVFDPQTYDIVNVSSFIAYEFHNYFTEKNVLKLFVYSGYDATWSNPINDLNLYSTSIQTGFNIYYKFENTIDIGLYNSLNFNTYNSDSKDEFSQNGKYFDSIFLTNLPITSTFILSLGVGYVGSKADGSIFTYNGLSGRGRLSFKFLNFLELSSNIKFEKRSYENELRDDQLLILGGNINFDFGTFLDMDLFYSYSNNDSILDDFSYEKHLVGVYFNFIM